MVDEPEEAGGEELTEDQLAAYQVVFEGLQNPPTTSAGLYEFLYALTGERIPFKPLCPDHNTPWDYIWRSYRIDLPEWRSQTKRDLVAVGPRGGHKTLSEAKLIAAEMLLKKSCGVIGMGAVLQQADRCFAYVSRYLKHPVVVASGMVTKLLTTEAELKNGSKYEQVCATLSGVNSPHEPKLRVDEVDLIKEEVLEEAKMMPTSRGPLVGHTAYCSTLKFLDGAMMNLVENGEMRDYDVLTWCIKDVSEPCPESRRGTQPRAYEVEDLFKPGETVVVQAYEGCKDCPLLPMCRGDLAKATGSVSLDDTIRDWKTMDRETFMVQKLCRRPKMAGKFFSEFDERIHVGSFKYNPHLPTDLFIDFTNGGDSPMVIQVWQEDNQGIGYCFADRRFVNMTTRQIGDRFRLFCEEHGIKSFRHQVGDCANPQAIKDFNSMFPEIFKIKPSNKILRVDGWPLCRKALRDNDGVARIIINRDLCEKVDGIDFPEELKKAKRSSSNPADIAKICSDHGLDAFRYREVFLHSKFRDPNIILLEPPVVAASDETNIIPPPAPDDDRPFFDRVWDADRDD